jgi:hypothetical protein
MAAGFVMAVSAGLALSGLLIGEQRAKANAVATAGSMVFGVCDAQFVKNVKVKSLGRSDFEVTWEYTPPDPCLTPKEFRVVIEARRRVGGSILGTKTVSVAGSARRAVGEFRSIAGIDLVNATVTPIIEIKPLSATGQFAQQ